jgi:2-polyprenyl-3-methyl-5-hydroxy-6-metoxy-1,4-benzoquinol methylase
MSLTAPATGTPYRTEVRYTDRLSKASYIADKYAAILTGSVLDVGCDRAPLRSLVANPSRYAGVDIRPDADIVADLDKQDLPLADRSFDTVVCTDVLEHLERCHAVFDELCRVSRSRVIVSLPNPLRNLLMAISEGSGGRLKYYGLPVDPPRDRHRWFFGFEEAAEFLRERGGRAGFLIEQLDSEEGGCPSWRGRGGDDLLGSRNVRAGTLWCVLARGPGDAESDRA